MDLPPNQFYDAAELRKRPNRQDRPAQLIRSNFYAFHTLSTKSRQRHARDAVVSGHRCHRHCRLSAIGPQPISLRLFAFLVPTVFYTLYFVDLAIVGPIIFQSVILWSAPFWTGAPVIAGIAGFLLSFVMLPPAQVDKESNNPVV